MKKSRCATPTSSQKNATYKGLCCKCGNLFASLGPRVSLDARWGSRALNLGSMLLVGVEGLASC
eukprot:3569213-Karenia_brevis.AAC.1